MRAALAAIAADGLWSVAALDFELGYLLEPAAAPADWSPPANRPLARFWRFRQRIAMDPTEAEEWLAANRKAIDAYNERVGRDGVWSEQVRGF